MKKKISLICIELDNASVYEEFTPPFGLLTAATVIQNCGWSVSIHHLVAKKGFEIKLLELCKNTQAVGFSVMTSPNLNAVLKASRIIKDSGCNIFWGGTHPTLLPDIALKGSNVDVVLRGEAEATLPAYIDYLEGKISLFNVPGACFYGKNNYLHISPIPSNIPSSKIVGHSFDLIDLSIYLHRNEHMLTSNNKRIKNVLPMVTSRGCQFTCAFCYNQAVHRNTWRSLSIERIFTEMDYLIENYDIGGWYFYDDNFFRDMERAWSILERYKMPSFVESHVSRVNKEFISRALDAGISRLYIGGESGSDSTLRKIRKATTVSRIYKAVKACSQAGLPVCVSLMIFLPNETPDEMKLTFEFKKEIEKLPYITVDGPKVYNPYPGTDFYQQLINDGWVSPQSNEEWSKFVRNINPILSGFRLTQKHKEILDKYDFKPTAT